MIFKKIPGVLPEDTLFIHGNMASNIWWQPVLQVLAEQSRGQNWQGCAYLGEIPGFGDQPELAQQKNLQLEDLAKWFCREIEQSQISPLHIVGHSTGGLLAALIASLSPELIRRSVLLDPVGPSGLPQDGRLKELFSQMLVNPTLLEKVLAFAVHHAEQVESGLWQKILADADKALHRVGDDLVRMLMQVEVSDLLSHSKSDTLVLFGEHDQVLQTTEAQRLARLLAKGKFSVVDGCGHSMNLEKPAQFVSILHDHLFNS